MQRTSKSPWANRITYASAPKVPVKTTAAEFLAANKACKGRHNYLISELDKACRRTINDNEYYINYKVSSKWIETSWIKLKYIFFFLLQSIFVHESCLKYLSEIYAYVWQTKLLKNAFRIIVFSTAPCLYIGLNISFLYFFFLTISLKTTWIC